jgi:hypothetical protein
MILEQGVDLPDFVKSKKTDDVLKLVRAMSVGDSVFIPDAKNQKDSRVERVRKIIYRMGWKQCVRVVEGGVRLWRVS